MKTQDYYNNPAMSYSKLKVLLNETPRHFYEKFMTGDIENTPTATMNFGNAFDTFMLQPDEFEKNYIVTDGFKRSSLEGCDGIISILESYMIKRELFIPRTGLKTIGEKRSYIDDLEKLCDGKLISGADLEKLKRCMQSIKASKSIELLLSQKWLTQQAMFMDDDGMPLKGLMDVIIEPCDLFQYGAIIDIKTTQDASDRWFMKSIVDYHYLLQGGVYSKLFKHKYNTAEHPSYFLIAVENSAPYLTNVFYVAPEEINMGLKLYAKAKAIYKDCLATGVWKGYDDKIKQLDLPLWYMEKYDL